MKIPEPLFVIVNPAVRLLLASPLHGLASKSLLSITYTGRRSGRRYTTPLRYMRDGDVIRCFTSRDTSWWRNLQDEQDVSLRIAGSVEAHLAEVIVGEPDTIRARLVAYFEMFPRDTDYHDIRLDANGKPLPQDLDRACQDAVVVEMRRAR
ncbi:MAG: nitroreductase/quinone reductase family protein [Gammaproteobacteria bacterium]|nr:nitroreductase/quinone reductase family protein [Gammaproteobacteria bacterium]